MSEGGIYQSLHAPTFTQLLKFIPLHWPLLALAKWVPLKDSISPCAILIISLISFTLCRKSSLIQTSFLWSIKISNIGQYVRRSLVCNQSLRVCWLQSEFYCLHVNVIYPKIFHTHNLSHLDLFFGVLLPPKCRFQISWLTGSVGLYVKVCT